MYKRIGKYTFPGNFQVLQEIFWPYWAWKVLRPDPYGFLQQTHSDLCNYINMGLILDVVKGIKFHYAKFPETL